jgi:ATP-dependent RNA helicase SUPV3L1/SUV3
MGLNLDVDAVVFAELRKFDGRQARVLHDAELAQIAGRAGRHLRDGQFATLEPLPALPDATVRALEQHRFPADQRLYWRNHLLDLDSVEGLLSSLRRRPPAPWLRLAEDAEDLRAVTALCRIPDVQALAQGPERVALLWQVCQIPDFRQRPFDDHFHLIAAAYRQLCAGRQRLGRDWIDEHLRRLDRPDGDLETLLDRMSAVRTWTYVTAHGQWVDGAPEWQARTHDLEDRLSDALHQMLVQRFVDEPGRRRRSAGSSSSTSSSAGMRSLAGELAAKVPGARAWQASDSAALSGADDDGAWVEPLVDAPHARFRVQGDGRILVDDRVVGRLVRGAGRLHPEAVVIPPLPGGARLRLGRRLLAFARDLVAELLAPLPAADETLGPAARGIVYQLHQNLGSVSVAATRAQLEALAPAERRRLVAAGIVFGRLTVFAPRLLSPEALRRRQALCAAERWPSRWPLRGAISESLPVCLPIDIDDQLDDQTDAPALPYEALGYLVTGAWALRADEAEDIARDLARGAPPTAVTPALARRLGLSPSDAAALASALRGLSSLKTTTDGRRRRRTRRPATALR